MGVTAALVSSFGSQGPRPLHLAAGRSFDAAPWSATASGGSGYTLVGTLPTGAPADAAA